MKSLLVITLGLISTSLIGQNALNKVDINTWKPPYNLVLPSGWTSERFFIPFDFAPNIPYKGVADVRFAPGWAKRTSADYWSYAYLWWLEGKPKINAASLQKNLTAYYSGLVAKNINSRHIIPSQVIPTTVILKKITSSVINNRQLYSGTITMLDYMTQKSIKLNCLIHVTTDNKQNFTAVIVELSPNSVDHIIWQQLHAIQGSFSVQKL